MRRHDRIGDLGDLASLVHRRLADLGIGLGFGQAAAVHQDALGPVDRLALGQLAARFVEVGLEPREGVEPPHRDVDQRPDAARRQPVDDIGRDTRIDRGGGSGQPHPEAHPDRAKKEGALVWYMSASIEDAQAILLAFSKKYPFLKTDFFRAGSARLFNRIMNEARAGKVLFDLVAVRGLETHQLVKAGLLQPYVSPESAAYPAGFKDSKGNWVDYFDSYNVIGYNTQRVARDQAPKSWEDLLDPKWKGKIALDEENFSWYGAMTQTERRKPNDTCGHWPNRISSFATDKL